MTNESTREAAARRALQRSGMRLEKSRAKNLHANNMGGYQIINADNIVVDGSNYEMTLEQVEAFVTDRAA